MKTTFDDFIKETPKYHKEYLMQNMPRNLEFGELWSLSVDKSTNNGKNSATFASVMAIYNNLEKNQIIPESQHKDNTKYNYYKKRFDKVPWNNQKDKNFYLSLLNQLKDKGKLSDKQWFYLKERFPIANNNITEILNKLTFNFKSENIDNNLIMKIKRLDDCYRIYITNKNDELISNVDIQPLKDRLNSYIGDKDNFNLEVKNFHVNEDFRNNGLGSKMLKKVIDIFGDQNLYIYPNPNRIKNLDENNIEQYRKSLINFYSRYGFKKIPTSDFGMKR